MTHLNLIVRPLPYRLTWRQKLELIGSRTIGVVVGILIAAIIVAATMMVIAGVIGGLQMLRKAAGG